MEKETVLAKIRATIEFSDKAHQWLEKLEKEDVWFAKQRGALFFSEFRRTWEGTLITSAEPIINDYFLKLGLSENRLPKLKIYESYHGSFIMEAALTMFGTVGTVYTVLKGISEIPQIADGLVELKERLKKAFSRKASEKVREHLNSSSNRYEIPAPPSNPINTDFSLDARPLLSLTPSIMKSHKVHLNVAVSRDSFTLENLGQEMIRDLRIGIFKSFTQRDFWKYAESYMGTIDILSSQQTITKDIADYRNSSGDSLDLSDSRPLHVDCWVQDAHGIYLFMFYLDD
jgi:hypothetical protein